MNSIDIKFYLLLLFTALLITSCSDDDEPMMKEEVEEVINQIKLTFTPDNGEDTVTAEWFDADGDGIDPPTIDAIQLEEGVNYELSLELYNTLGSTPIDISSEIKAEGDEHMFFFSFTNDMFSDPVGDGNIDLRNDPLNYNDQDVNGQPLGLSTNWSAGAHTEAQGEFTIILKHQPDLKSATSDATTGGTDIDISFPIDIVEEAYDEEEEVINQVVLTFTPNNGKEAVIAEWYDADGEGVGNPTIDEIELEEDVTYALSISLMNTLGTEPENITAEIKEEDDEHMFFFSFTEDIFSNPIGDGNADNRMDALNYGDMDENDLPVGLETTWTAGEHTTSEGMFTIILKHQPDLKTSTSDATVGGTDVDITFPIHIEEEHGPNEEEEVINRILLTFQPTAGGDAITAAWFDADGEGVGNPSIDEIGLAANTEYDMSITLGNTLGAEVEDITAEISEEADEHMFFFGFTTDIFSNPTGDGNIDGRQDPLVYNDQDSNSNPVGLSTKWTTGEATSSQSDFRIVLKHQPDLKTATSDATVGGTDVDITLPLKIQ